VDWFLEYFFILLKATIFKGSFDEGSEFYLSPDSFCNSGNEDSSSSSPTNVSPKSNSSFNIPSSSDLVVVKREVLEVERGSPEQLTCTGNRPEEAKPKSSSLDIEDVQDAPEDLSSAGQSKSSFRFNFIQASHNARATIIRLLKLMILYRLKLNPSSLVKISPLKSLLREDWRKDVSSCSRVFGTTNNSNSSSSKSNGNSNGRNSVTTGHTNLPSGYQVRSLQGHLLYTALLFCYFSFSLGIRRGSHYVFRNVNNDIRVLAESQRTGFPKLHPSVHLLQNCISRHNTLLSP